MTSGGGFRLPSASLLNGLRPIPKILAALGIGFIGFAMWERSITALAIGGALVSAGFVGHTWSEPPVWRCHGPNQPYCDAHGYGRDRHLHVFWGVLISQALSLLFFAAAVCALLFIVGWFPWLRFAK
jgi:hypothetical protein